jgi:hypothetical protein
MGLGQGADGVPKWRLPRALSLSQGRIVIGVAIALVLIATAFALVPGPSSGPVGPEFPVLDDRLGGILIDYSLITSALLVAVGASAWPQGLRRVLLSATIIVAVGVAEEGLAFYLATPVNSGSVTFYVQPYPQSWFPLVYGVLLLLFAPTCWLLRRQARRTSLLVDAPRVV